MRFFLYNLITIMFIYKFDLNLVLLLDINYGIFVRITQLKKVSCLNLKTDFNNFHCLNFHPTIFMVELNVTCEC